jgi:transposase
MSRWKLTAEQCRRLRQQLAVAEDARLYRRTLAVLEVGRGRPAADVARMLGVSRQSVYNWVEAFAQQPHPVALGDAPRSGRPAVVDGRAEEWLRLLLGYSPQILGYAAASWTVPLLRDALGRDLQRWPSGDAIRRALHRLGYVWKRPRYRLAPDPEREKKTADLPANRGLAAAQRGAGRGRDRPAAVPAAAGRLGGARRAGTGCHQRRERPPRRLRRDEPADGQPPAVATYPGS